jgi:hypothetical protein
MVVLRFKIANGVLNVPIADVKSVLEKGDGTGIIAFKTAIDPVTVKNVGEILAKLSQTPPVAAAPASIFEAIFGK